MLHRKKTLEILKTSKKSTTELYMLALQLVLEQQEYIELLTQKLSNARKAAKGNLVGITRLQLECNKLKQKIDFSENYYKDRYNKLVTKWMEFEKDLARFNIKYKEKTLSELVSENTDRIEFVDRILNK